MFSYVRVASLLLLAGSSSLAAAQSLDADAIAFGTREGVSNMDLSPDGRQAVFVGPGPGRTSIAYHVDIARGTTSPIMSSAGNPENLRWCAFVSNERIACQISAIVQTGPS
jgi:hypothetical protein